MGLLLTGLRGIVHPRFMCCSVLQCVAIWCSMLQYIFSVSLGDFSWNSAADVLCGCSVCVRQVPGNLEPTENWRQNFTILLENVICEVLWVVFP